MAINKRTHSATDAMDVTPNDTVSDATEITSDRATGGSTPTGILVSVSGAVRVVMVTGRVQTLPTLAAGIIHPIQYTHVLATGTTATGIVAAFQ